MTLNLLPPYRIVPNAEKEYIKNSSIKMTLLAAGIMSTDTIPTNSKACTANNKRVNRKTRAMTMKLRKNKHSVVLVTK
jgi:hypothetical protein